MPSAWRYPKETKVEGGLNEEKRKWPEKEGGGERNERERERSKDQTRRPGKTWFRRGPSLFVAFNTKELRNTNGEDTPGSA